jgi:hypothetical protein
MERQLHECLSSHFSIHNELDGVVEMIHSLLAIMDSLRQRVTDSTRIVTDAQEVFNQRVAPSHMQRVDASATTAAPPPTAAAAPATTRRTDSSSSLSSQSVSPSIVPTAFTVSRFVELFLAADAEGNQYMHGLDRDTFERLIIVSPPELEEQPPAQLLDAFKSLSDWKHIFSAIYGHFHVKTEEPIIAEQVSIWLRREPQQQTFAQLYQIIRTAVNKQRHKERVAIMRHYATPHKIIGVVEGQLLEQGSAPNVLRTLLENAGEHSSVVKLVQHIHAWAATLSLRSVARDIHF